MGKNIRFRILYLLVMFLSVTAGGCGKEKTLSFYPNETISVVNPEEVNIADMLQDTASGVIVQLRAGSSLGSGVIFKLDEKEMIVVTAAHVIADAENVKLLLKDGSTQETAGIYCSESADVGFLRLDMKDVELVDSGLIQYAVTDRETFDALAAGDGIIVMGSRDGIAANAYEGEILEPWIYLEDFQQYMLWGWTTARPGMSGGGVFDQSGRFIGILCGGNEDNEIAVLPLSIILSEFDMFFGL